MPAQKKLPWFSLTLLLITYMAFGWLLPVPDSFWDWILPTPLVFLIAIGLTVPLTSITKGLTSLLKSDFRAFMTVILAAFAVVIIIRWIVVSARILTLVTAEALARLDLQTAGYTQRQAFLVLATVSLLGLISGLIVHRAILGHLNAL